MGSFKSKLVSQLIQSDDRQSKRPESYNRYALGMYLRAADECAELVDNGTAPEKAFSDIFNPTREMHRVAKCLGLSLDVQKGQWIL